MKNNFFIIFYLLLLILPSLFKIESWPLSAFPMYAGGSFNFWPINSYRLAVIEYPDKYQLLDRSFSLKRSAIYQILNNQINNIEPVFLSAYQRLQNKGKKPKYIYLIKQTASPSDSKKLQIEEKIIYSFQVKESL